MTYPKSNTAQIRQTLEIAFDDSALSAFCFDYFPKVYDRFTQGMRKDDKITLLLDDCRRYPTGFETFKDNVDNEYARSNFQRKELKPLIDALLVYNHSHGTGPKIKVFKRRTSSTNTPSLTAWWQQWPMLAGTAVLLIVLTMIVTLAMTRGFVADVAVYVERGDNYIEQSNYDQAITDYSEAIRIDPDYADAYYSRGWAYYEQGNYKQAIADYSEAIRIDPDYADAYYSRGWAYDKQGNYEQAIADYNEAIRLTSHLAIAYVARGFAYGKQENYGQAIADYNEAIRLDPDYANAYYSRGLTYHNQDNYKQAIADYNEAIRINSDYAFAYNNRGVAYEKVGNREQAIADYRKALELDNNPEATRLAQENLRRLGEE